MRLNNSKIKSLFQNQDIRGLAGNFFYLSILKIISFVFPLITLPYLTRVIGVEKFGAIAFATAVIVIVETVVDWGFNYTATRDAARVREDIDVVSQIFSEVIFSKLTLMVICFILLFSLLPLFSLSKETELLLLLTFAYIPGHILFPEWLFQAFEQMKYITILNVLSKLIFTVLVFVVIREQSDYVFQPLLVACGYIVSGIIAMFVLVKRYGVYVRFPKFGPIFKRLKSSTNMFVSLIVPNLYNNFSVILLRTYCGDGATGIYSGGEKFHGIVDQLTQVLSRVFFPFLARHKDKHSLYVKIIGTIAVLMSLLMFFGADLFVDIFLTPNFSDSAIVIRILALSPIFLFLSNAYGTNYLVLVGKENLMRNIYVVWSLVGFALAWILVPRFGYVGVAFVLLSIRGTIGVSNYLVAKRLMKEKTHI